MASSSSRSAKRRWAGHSSEWKRLSPFRTRLRRRTDASLSPPERQRSERREGGEGVGDASVGDASVGDASVGDASVGDASVGAAVLDPVDSDAGSDPVCAAAPVPVAVDPDAVEAGVAGVPVVTGVGVPAVPSASAADSGSGGRAMPKNASSGSVVS